MIQKFEVTIPGLSGDKERRAYIYLPENYGKGKKYPVLYMFDGHNLFYDTDATFGKSWGMKEYLERAEAEIIVAAVECNHEGHRRLEEYSPVDFTFNDGTALKGQGKIYMDWLVGEFKPYIDKNYDTLPDRHNTAIGGSSMGGLMTLYALCSYNEIFSRGAALSPSLWLGNGNLCGFIEEAKFQKDTVIYADYGSKEFSNHSTQKRAFAKTCATLIEKNAVLTARIVDGGTHCEASWEKSIPYFMKVLFDIG